MAGALIVRLLQAYHEGAGALLDGNCLPLLHGPSSACLPARNSTDTPCVHAFGLRHAGEPFDDENDDDYWRLQVVSGYYAVAVATLGWC